MKYSAILLLVLLFTGCCKDNEGDDLVQYPSLMIVNENQENYVITRVALVDYEFHYLNIPVEESQLFALDDGMAGGYEDIYISVGYDAGSITRYLHIEVDFDDGETTTITLKGCNAEGCEGLYLE